MNRYQIPPIAAFPHTIVYRQKTGEDDYQKPTYEDQTVNYAWFNLASTFSRGGNNSTVKTKNSSVTMLTRYCGILPEFTVDSPLVFRGKEYNIVLAKELLLNGELIGWRLEVV